MTVSDFIRKKKKEDKEFNHLYEELSPELDIGEQLFRARTIAGLSQEQLAKKAQTSQSSLARVESGNHLPSLSYLQKIANALDTELLPPRFQSVVEFEDNKTFESNTENTVSDLISSPVQYNNLTDYYGSDSNEDSQPINLSQ